MKTQTLTIERFDGKRADERQLNALHAFTNRMRAEYWPDDPPQPYQETVGRWRALPPFVEREAWAAWQNGEIVALALADVWRVEDNQHLADVEIEVLPPWRNRGLGVELLDRTVDVAERKGRRLMIFGTDTNIPAGEAFARRLDARLGIEARTNQLDLSDLDREQMRQWIERGEARAADYELGLWEGAYPEDRLDEVVRLREVMNTAPRDDLEIEDMKRTPEELRQMEASLATRGVERWSLYARHKPSGNLAGYTEVFWSPHEPTILYQGDTGVFPEHRGNSLGRWLKAAMMEKVLQERSSVERVRTGNAASNGPMLKINYDMGFRHVKTWKIWQVETEEVRAYLDRRAARVDTAQVPSP